MERVNQTSSVSEFILLGLSSRPGDQKPLFILFLTMYLVTITGNLLIILAIHSDPQLQTPMYFFLSFLSFTDICFTTTIVPRMLLSFLSEKTISYAGCLTQMYFIYALGNTDSFFLAVMALDRYVAICDPFHYVTTMNHDRCVLLVAFSCSLPHLHSLLHTLLLNRLTFCDNNVIHHFLCDLSPLMKLSCSSTFLNEIVIMSEGSVVLVTPFVCITFSYIRILITVLKIPSAAGKRKAFSTCGSHLTVVTLFYGSIFYVYLQPLSTYTARDHIATLVYTVLTSMLNPFIYSLRNKDLKQGLRKLMGRRKSQAAPS
ncbi:olfactory receptor 1L8-like [Acinonyx jubatus]|uniref:Olfactory receptor n=2 Tax=Felinae TaxID=338152 RepID=A0ABM3NMG6_ACIJB|nr:olfactory receptor 1L8-like [Acinonyx jubatus]XP_053060637.1 olfactory receptor 1L8-like [Acinonyx jubatus]XP_053060638.1 olfactory receptor 1L8-like [Acinonyx jubatus]